MASEKMAAQKWRPPLSEPGLELWNCRKRYVLVHGPRMAGKSIAIAEKMLKHAMSWPGSDLIILTRTLAKGEAGVWRNLTKAGGVIEKWQKAGFARYHAKPGKEGGPSYAAASKVPTIKLSNGPGKPHSTIQMITLADDAESELKLKDLNGDFIYCCEADSFDQHVISTLRMCLRSTLVPYDAQQMILDMNPPAEGRRHYAYRFIENPGEDEIAIKFPLEKNCFITDKERQGVFNTYAHDPNRLQRYYYGEWVEMSDNSCFTDVFNEQLHIVGEPLDQSDDYSNLDRKLILRPWTGAYQFDMGWDIGDKNTAVTLLCPRQQGESLCYDCLDEVVILEQKLSMESFLQKVIAMMDYWQEWMRVENGVSQPMWRHYSDSSSMRERMNLSGSEAQLISNLTGGRINLTGVQKGRNSVEMRRQLLRRLLFENRIAISSKCENVIQMLRHLPPAKSKELTDKTGNKRLIMEGVDSYSQHKHVYDGITYPLSACIPLGLYAPSGPNESARIMTMEL